ncbi:hypothetical protein AAVH_15148, partial [Aphelenchoides avenae]
MGTAYNPFANSQTYVGFIRDNAFMFLTFICICTTIGLALRAFFLRNSCKVKRQRSTLLPTEVLTEVFKFLDGENLDAVELVSRRFSDIVDEDTSPSLRHFFSMTLKIDC